MIPTSAPATLPRMELRRTIARIPGARAVRDRLRPPTRHRGYVGGMWDEIGRHQVEWVVAQGLQPNHVFLDIACGSLRGGRFFIDYLDRDHYLGIDRNRWLIEAGLKHEVSPAVRKQKRPRFVVSDRFEFERFGSDIHPDYAIAQSLFSHLTPGDIRLCLSNLRPFLAEHGRFFATYVPRGTMPDGYANPDASDDSAAFEYTPDDLIALATETGWRAINIGDWGHPRGQQMMELRPEP